MDVRREHGAAITAGEKRYFGAPCCEWNFRRDAWEKMWFLCQSEMSCCSRKLRVWWVEAGSASARLQHTNYAARVFAGGPAEKEKNPNFSFFSLFLVEQAQPDLVEKKSFETAQPIAEKIGDCLGAICDPKQFWVSCGSTRNS